MMQRTMWRRLWAAVALVTVAAASIASADDFEYDGLKKCKGCHKSEYKSWRKTRHAKALKTLKPGVKVEAKRKAKLDPDKDYSEDEKCVRCHVTGYGADGGYDIEDPGIYLVNVGCESCHGPGADYRVIHRKASNRFEKSKKATPRRQLADAGEEFEFVNRCKACHMNYEGSPWPGAKKPYTPFTPDLDPKYAFDFDKKVRDAKAMHEHFKLEGVFTGPPKPAFHDEFQRDAKSKL